MLGFSARYPYHRRNCVESTWFQPLKLQCDVIAFNFQTLLSTGTTPCVCPYVTAELLLGQPLFPGESGVDQLVEIIKVGCSVFGVSVPGAHCEHVSVSLSLSVDRFVSVSVSA